MKLAFINVPFRHNSACVIQKWLKFRGVVITVRFKHSFIFFNVNEQMVVPFVELYGMGPMWGISVSFLYTGLLVWAFPKSQLNLAYGSKSFLVLAFCFLFVCMTDPTQMYPSSISPLGLFQGIICNIERLKSGTLEPCITGGPKLEGGIQTPHHTVRLNWDLVRT